ncbi:MAG: hypothetical protein GPOALKHO_000397 [Sodalis sp.]|nr:MAG: hypothetical protein GPOALKHO_000397 [Sodalis sp.]
MACTLLTSVPPAVIILPLTPIVVTHILFPFSLSNVSIGLVHAESDKLQGATMGRIRQ